jgi:hypothetical protein
MRGGVGAGAGPTRAVLIRGAGPGSPSRFESDESYFEYGCDGADGRWA